MHDLPLLVNIAVAIAAALVGGLAARAVGVLPLVGYLLAGVAIGPFTPGFVGDADRPCPGHRGGRVALARGRGRRLELLPC